MGATLFVPALTRLGVTPLAAHMFVFYFACLSMITPPVALASYAAAAIANTSSSSVGWLAVRIAIPVFLVPYAFVAAPSLLAQGELRPIIINTITALAGVGALAAATVGYFRTVNRLYETIALAIAACALIYPDLWISVIGAVIAAAIWLLQRMRIRRIVTVAA